jgi:hypothetical protein
MSDNIYYVNFYLSLFWFPVQALKEPSSPSKIWIDIVVRKTISYHGFPRKELLNEQCRKKTSKKDDQAQTQKTEKKDAS